MAINTKFSSMWSRILPSTHMFDRVFDNELSSPFNQMISSSNEFSLDFHKVLAQKNENFVISPITTFMALALMYIGAKGKTAEQIAKSLHLPAEKEVLLNGTRKLIDQLEFLDLHCVNALFFDKQYKMRQEFKDIANTTFDLKLANVDFADKPQAARREINNFVFDKTRAKFKNIFPAGSLNKLTKMILLSTVHFKRKWLVKADQELTWNDDFYSSHNKYAQIPTIRLKSEFRWLKQDTFEVLELLYKLENFRLLIFLPEKNYTLKDVERNITLSDFRNVLNALKETKYAPVKVQIPKLKLEKFYKLKDVLKKLGLNNTFDSSKANFLGINEGNKSVFVSDVIQKVFVQVTEDSNRVTTVAWEKGKIQSTTVGWLEEPQRSWCKTNKPQIHSFIVNRPFMFFVLYRNIILLNGRYAATEPMTNFH